MHSFFLSSLQSIGYRKHKTSGRTISHNIKNYNMTIITGAEHITEIYPEQV